MDKNYKDMRKYISILYRQFHIYINNNIKDLEIGASEYIFLMEMYKENNISQEQLSKNLIVDKAATARAIKSLEEKGYIIRNKDENDKRTNRIKLTQKGIEIEGRLKELLEQWNSGITSEIGSETMNIALDVLKYMSIKAIEKNRIQ
ncbi:MarR family winged helix-turn-helix transcriptional regulator [Terrisporobacter sp.]